MRKMQKTTRVEGKKEMQIWGLIRLMDHEMKPLRSYLLSCSLFLLSMIFHFIANSIFFSSYMALGLGYSSFYPNVKVHVFLARHLSIYFDLIQF